MKRSNGGRRRPFRKYLFIFAVLAALGFGIYVVAGASHAPRAGRPPLTAKERNEVRRADLKLLASSIQSYTAEVGPIPAKVPKAATGVCSAGSANCKKGGTFDMAFLTSTGHLVSVPNDPSGGPEMYSSGYTIARDPSGQITLSAPRAEEGATITEIVK